MTTLSSELIYTGATAAFTGLIWVPIILNRLGEMGAWKALKNPEPDVRPQAIWAYRLSHAHRNAVENLVVFAPLALAVHIAGLSNPVTALACLIFFIARVTHAVIYTFGIPLLRTIAFAIGCGSQVVVALRLFGLL